MNSGGTPIHKVLRAAAPGATLTEAVRRRDAWLPCFLAAADAIPAGPAAYHSGSVLAHTARCMDAMAGDPLAVWMAMVHDAGKLTTPAVLLPHHYGHEQRGAVLAAVWTRHLGLSEEFRQAATLAALQHMKAGRYARLRPGKKYDLLRVVAAGGFFTPFWKVVDADTKSAISEKAREDWQRVQSIPFEGMTDERLRQIAILALCPAESEL